MPPPGDAPVACLVGGAGRRPMGCPPVEGSCYGGGGCIPVPPPQTCVEGRALLGGGGGGPIPLSLDIYCVDL